MLLHLLTAIRAYFDYLVYILLCIWSLVIGSLFSSEVTGHKHSPLATGYQSPLYSQYRKYIV